MALWTPANLINVPKVVLDGSTVSWSGSNFGSTPNTGNGGGNIVNAVGTAVKGTQLNGFDVVNFDGVVSLGLASQNWTSGNNVFIFSVFRATATSYTLASHGWGTLTTGWVFYPRIVGGATVGGTTVNTDDVFSLTSGYDGVSGYMVYPTPFNTSSYSIMTWQGGSINFLRKNGTVLTSTVSSTRTVSAQTGVTIYFGDSHINNPSTTDEPLIGDIAYLLLFAGAPTLDEYQKLEGWAAWRFGLVSSLDAGHPYKSFAPITEILLGMSWM